KRKFTGRREQVLQRDRKEWGAARGRGRGGQRTERNARARDRPAPSPDALVRDAGRATPRTRAGRRHHSTAAHAAADGDGRARCARRGELGSLRGVMVGGRGVRLAPSCGVREPELFLCLDADAGEGEAWVRQASGVRRDWLAPDMLTVTTDVEFDPAAERVIA